MNWAGYSVVELTGFIRKSEVRLGRIKHLFFSEIIFAVIFLEKFLYTFWCRGGLTSLLYV